MSAKNPPCVECGEPGFAGVGEPPEWLCLAHFDGRLEAIGERIDRFKAAVRRELKGLRW